MAERSLLLFRDQYDLTPGAHVAFSRGFGELEEHVLSDFCLEGHPEIFVVSNIIENGKHIGAFVAQGYHSDLAYCPSRQWG